MNKTRKRKNIKMAKVFRGRRDASAPREKCLYGIIPIICRDLPSHTISSSAFPTTAPYRSSRSAGIHRENLTTSTSKIAPSAENKAAKRTMAYPSFTNSSELELKTPSVLGVGAFLPSHFFAFSSVVFISGLI